MRFEFADTLTARDFKRHIPHTFLVPEGCTRLAVRFAYSPPRVGDIRNMLTLTIFDPAGFRGAGHRHGNVHEVEFTPTSASPGYRRGPLPPGEWTVQIDTHMILPGADCPYTLTVTGEIGALGESDADRPAAGQTVGHTVGHTVGQTVAEPQQAASGKSLFERVTKAQPGWYRGDLHSHTWHSDAAWDVPDLIAAARKVGVDFVALTDHNTTAPLAQMASLSGPDLLTLGGMELTTFWGHAVCLGAESWIDWRVDPAGEVMNAIAAAQYAAGNIFIIAHPQDEGDPICTGCRWVYPHMRPGTARFVEVWNGRWQSTDPRTKNEGSLGLWYDWLNQGLRITATAGSDAHGPAHYGVGVGFNVVYAPELSQRGILQGLRDGQVYLSAGPTLTFSAHDRRGNSAAIGGTLVAQEATELRAAWIEAPEAARLRLIRSGEVLDERPIGPAGEGAWTLDVEPGHWFVLELRRDDGWMCGLTNPIFFD